MTSQLTPDVGCRSDLFARENHSSFRRNALEDDLAPLLKSADADARANPDKVSDDAARMAATDAAEAAGPDLSEGCGGGGLILRRSKPCQQSAHAWNQAWADFFKAEPFANPAWIADYAKGMANRYVLIWHG